MKRLIILAIVIIAGITCYAQKYDITTLKEKAEQGDAKAQYDLYDRYISGITVKKDNDMALYYLCQSADNDYPEALYKLGFYYKIGELGLPVWKEKAYDYLFRAYELGNKSAKSALNDKELNYAVNVREIRKAIKKQTDLITTTKTPHLK